MTDDTLQDETGLRTLPTDEINYMRNSVKATVDAYDGTVTLYAWDEQDPLLKAWSAAFPGTVKPKSDISDALMEHLRYPEDMFKVQRYQFARYHVTDPNAWFQDNNRWEVPEDPNGAKAYQPPYRMFVTQPPGLVPSADNAADLPPVPTGQVWSMTSTFVPYKRLNLAAYVSVDSDATSETYGQIRVIDVIDEQQQGPSQVANSMQSDPDVSERLAEFNRSGNSLTYGNLLTVPLGDELMYVEPVYARRATASEANFPILRYVLVSYKGGVGLGTTLQSALETAIANVDEPDDGEPTDSGDADADADGRAHRRAVPDQQLDRRPRLGRGPARPGPAGVRARRRGPRRPVTCRRTRSTSRRPATWSSRRWTPRSAAPRRRPPSPRRRDAPPSP